MEVSVRSPFPFEALPRVWTWIQRFRHRVADDFSPHTLDDFVDLQASKWEQQRSWAIYGDGELGGLITFERLNGHAGTAHLLLKPDFQGRGLAMPALRLAFAEMYALGVERLMFYVLQGNWAVGSLIVNLGGRREGCLRSHTLQKGKPIDVWIYGLMKAEFEGKQHELSVRKHQDNQQLNNADADRPGAGPLPAAS